MCTESVHRIPDQSNQADEPGSGAVTPMARKVSATSTALPALAPASPAPKGAPLVAPSVGGEEQGRRAMDAHRPLVAPAPAAPNSLIPPADKDGTNRDQQLKQRLKKAMGNMGA